MHRQHPAVDQIPSDRHHIRLERVHLLDHLRQPLAPDGLANVQVAQLHDAQPLQALAEPLDRDLHPLDPRPSGRSQIPVDQRRPDEARHQHGLPALIRLPSDFKGMSGQQLAQPAGEIGRRQRREQHREAAQPQVRHPAQRAAQPGHLEAAAEHPRRNRKEQRRHQRPAGRARDPLQPQPANQPRADVVVQPADQPDHHRQAEKHPRHRPQRHPAQRRLLARLGNLRSFGQFSCFHRGSLLPESLTTGGAGVSGFQNPGTPPSGCAAAVPTAKAHRYCAVLSGTSPAWRAASSTATTSALGAGSCGGSPKVISRAPRSKAR